MPGSLQFLVYPQWGFSGVVSSEKFGARVIGFLKKNKWIIQHRDKRMEVNYLAQAIGLWRDLLLYKLDKALDNTDKSEQ